MKSLFFSNRVEVESAYIITVKGNENSERYSKRCQMSCASSQMPFKIWDAYDGTKGEIIPPSHHTSSSIVNLLKITDHYMTRGEVACALSHVSLWNHCALIDQPIVILEHDAIVVKKFEAMNCYNSVVYLGGSEWAEQGWPMVHIPPHASEGPNYHFICRAHAYAIDPTMAKNLLAHVLRYGLVAPLDIMMRTDLFNVTHQGLFAYDKSNDKADTTILARPTAGRTTKRNDNLGY